MKGRDAYGSKVAWLTVDTLDIVMLENALLAYLGGKMATTHNAHSPILVRWGANNASK